MFFQLAKINPPQLPPPFPASGETFTSSEFNGGRWSAFVFFPLSILVSTPSVLFFNSCEACHFTWPMQFLGTFSLYRKAFRMAFRPKKKGAQIPNPPRRFHFEVRRDFEVEVLRATKKKARITEIQQKPGTHLKFFG